MSKPELPAFVLWFLIEKVFTHSERTLNKGGIE